MTTGRQRRDPVLAWGMMILPVVGGIVVHETHRDWRAIVGVVVAELALLAWRMPRRSNSN